MSREDPGGVTEFVAIFIFVYVILAATNPTVNLQIEAFAALELTLPNPTNGDV